jgi:hypothetical protein
MINMSEVQDREELKLKKKKQKLREENKSQ